MEGRRRKNKFSSGLISFQHERKKRTKMGTNLEGKKTGKEERLVQFCEATCASLCVFCGMIFLNIGLFPIHLRIPRERRNLLSKTMTQGKKEAKQKKSRKNSR
jgi:hypothetical protein